MGAINKDGMDFLSNIGRRITQSTDVYRECAFLFQRLSMLIQRYNAVSVMVTFTRTTPRMKCSSSSIVLVFNLVLALGIYTTGGKKIIIMIIIINYSTIQIVVFGSCYVL